MVNSVRLREKQKRFCEHYAKSGDATKSAILAGYSKKTASEMGYENLNKPHIAEYLKKINEKATSDRIADMKEVKELWTSIIRFEKIGTDIKDVLKASEYIAKTNGAFLDRVENSGAIEIEIDIEEDDDYDDG